MTDYCWNCPHVHDIVLHTLPIMRLLIEFCAMVCFILLSTCSMTQKTYYIGFFWKIQSQAISGNPGGENEVDVPETNHSKKASQGDHSGGHGGREDDDEEVRKCGQKIIQTHTIVEDTKSSRRLLQNCQPFFLIRYQDTLLQQFVFPNRVSFEFS